MKFQISSFEKAEFVFLFYLDFNLKGKFYENRNLEFFIGI
ncbi:hypothetical protein NU08_2551 [Flavobacterium anhuiense]|uniref:Uncharacterized protein n=1 Tax=Flavobacterium anhuiense TaxID=459526 RepID=A0A444VYG3_9FLAO|nr:hypothetical protein NU08_2551 [Flavobacterium anhuiense]